MHMYIYRKTFPKCTWTDLDYNSTLLIISTTAFFSRNNATEMHTHTHTFTPKLTLSPIQIFNQNLCRYISVCIIAILYTNSSNLRELGFEDPKFEAKDLSHNPCVVATSTDNILLKLSQLCGIVIIINLLPYHLHYNK